MLPWNAEDLTFDEARFHGKARLFPVPNLVMYPHVMQPLNIFEPRYIEMLNEALDSDGLIAMCVLMPGWEKDYENRPPVHSYACLSRVVTHQRQENGHYNILLLGMRRVRIEMELDAARSFREARVALLDDFCLTENDAERVGLQTALTQRFQECLPEQKAIHPASAEMLSTEIPLSVLTDLVSFALPLDLKTKCELLSENDVDRRAWILLDALDRHADEDRGADHPNNPFAHRPASGGYFPPFSEN
ncbi:MAG: LON peptidase substrate-binding domain-containing protein [Pirellulales bacterium]|nr:LON peptidase substrate-binding domain-containing protein [Pirellulales bacterium]